MIKNASIKYLITIINVLVLYAFTGFLGLSFLSTSPGFATPVWIPSGIALGCALIWGLRTLPGVFLGSLFLNYYVAMHLPHAETDFSLSVLVGIIIATGAVLQTLAGWFMIKKWIGLKNPLNSPNAILSFAFLSGPLSCLVNTTWSNTLLLMLNILPMQQYFYSWGTWWVGDSIGVLIFTPLFLILFAKPSSIWRERFISIFIPLLFSFIGVMVLYHIASMSGITELWSILIIGLLICVLINIILFIIQGQRNIVQMRMEAQTRILKFEEAKNSLILRSAGEGIFGIDMQGRITFINPAATKMLGYTENELIGKSIQPLIQHTDMNDTSGPRNHFTSQYGKTFRSRNEVFWRKDGSSFWVEYTSTPLIDRNKTIGAVIVFNDVTQQRESEFTLQKMAHYDALTGLPNRVSFLEKTSLALENAKSNQHVMAVCFIDIDNFKQINDNLGHHIGDEILKIVSKLLESQLSKMDYLARIGGDEFAVILENVISVDYMTFTLQRFINILSKPVIIDNHEIWTSLSIGVALYPSAGLNANELIKNADIAMYKAKESGKNTFVFFDVGLSKQFKRSQEIDLAMHQAMDREEFSIFYQPLIDTQSLQLIGFEILLRWNSSTLGEITPTEFIPIAEKNGLIHSLGGWVLEKACSDYRKITSIFKDNNLLLSINVSVLQLEKENFLLKIKNILNETEMNNNNLIFEITESELMQQPIHTIELINEIKKLGVRFALDDFGVSYSSMQYLKIIPLSLLKIDQTFIDDIATDTKDVAIVKSIVQLAHGLGISTIAEGIETKEQFEVLKNLGCEYTQGYFFAKPMSIEMLAQYELSIRKG